MMMSDDELRRLCEAETVGLELIDAPLMDAYGLMGDDAAPVADVLSSTLLAVVEHHGGQPGWGLLSLLPAIQQAADMVEARALARPTDQETVERLMLVARELRFTGQYCEHMFVTSGPADIVGPVMREDDDR